jgi:V/A-type H+-transporting ATPase subunit K
MGFEMIGPALVLGLGCLGSAIGCGIAGMASHGVMSRVDENHGRFIGISALPSSQAIYAFVLMLLMKQAIIANELSAASGIGIGIASGLAIMMSAIYQGKCGATAIQASAKQPTIYGKCLAALGIVESFALFAFVFALLLLRK